MKPKTTTERLELIKNWVAKHKGTMAEAVIDVPSNTYKICIPSVEMYIQIPTDVAECMDIFGFCGTSCHTHFLIELKK